MVLLYGIHNARQVLTLMNVFIFDLRSSYTVECFVLLFLIYSCFLVCDICTYIFCIPVYLALFVWDGNSEWLRSQADSREWPFCCLSVLHRAGRLAYTLGSLTNGWCSNKKRVLKNASRSQFDVWVISLVGVWWVSKKERYILYSQCWKKKYKTQKNPVK